MVPHHTSWMVGIDEAAPPAWPSQTNCCSWTTRDAVTLARFVATKGCLGVCNFRPTNKNRACAANVRFVSRAACVADVGVTAEKQ